MEHLLNIKKKIILKYIQLMMNVMILAIAIMDNIYLQVLMKIQKKLFINTNNGKYVKYSKSRKLNIDINKKIQ